MRSLTGLAVAKPRSPEFLVLSDLWQDSPTIAELRRSSLFTLAAGLPVFMPLGRPIEGYFLVIVVTNCQITFRAFVGKQFFQLSSTITFVSQHPSSTALPAASSTCCGLSFLRDWRSTSGFSLIPLHAFATLPYDCTPPDTPFDL